MKTINEVALFPMGRIVMTKGAQAELSPGDLLDGLVRHARGDWGELCNEDRESNEQALVHDFRLFSAYIAVDGTKYWVITEHDRSYTTILLPDEY